MCIDLPWRSQTFQAGQLDGDGDESVSDRQERVLGFSMSALARAHILMIGAGGLGGAIARGLVRKGAGKVDIADHDVVEESNLNRQFFFAEDLYRPKALRLAHNAAREGFLGGTVTGHFVGFTVDSARALARGVDVAVCGVDNNASRRLCSRFFRAAGIPCIFTAVNEGANFGWIFVQERVGPCLACVFPRVAEAGGQPAPCTPVPAVLDVVQLAGAVVLYACDTLLMRRERHWNFRDFNFVGGAPDVVCTVKERPGCPLCEEHNGK